MAPVNSLNRFCKGFIESGEHMPIRRVTKSAHESGSSSVIWNPLNHFVWTRRNCRERDPSGSNLRILDVNETTTYLGVTPAYRELRLRAIPCNLRFSPIVAEIEILSILFGLSNLPHQ